MIHTIIVRVPRRWPVPCSAGAAVACFRNTVQEQQSKFLIRVVILDSCYSSSIPTAKSRPCDLQGQNCTLELKVKIRTWSVG